MGRELVRVWRYSVGSNRRCWVWILVIAIAQVVSVSSSRVTVSRGLVYFEF